MTDLNVKVDSGKVVGNLLNILQNLPGSPDFRPVMDGIGSRLVNRVKLGFRNSEDPWGADWHPIFHREGKPLIDSGRLRSSITYFADSEQAAIGTNVEYAHAHQFGFSGPVDVPAHERRISKAFGKPIEPKTVNIKAHTRQANIKPRPFFPVDRDGGVELPDSWKRSVLEVISQHINKAVNKEN